MSEREEFMKAAIREAEKGKATAAPNPIVGAVIIEDGKIVAAGYHERPGHPHAEINALKNLARKPSPGAELYVTLEPCSTVGRTEKCTDAIVASGIKKVVIGCIDPNPEHRGRGIEILKKAGIEVITGVLEKECRELNPEFNKRMTERS